MEDQERLSQVGDMIGQSMPAGVLDKLPADRKLAPSQRDRCDAITLDVLNPRLEMLQHMGDIRRRPDGRHCSRLRNAVRSGKHCRAPKRMTD